MFLSHKNWQLGSTVTPKGRVFNVGSLQLQQFWWKGRNLDVTLNPIELLGQVVQFLQNFRRVPQAYKIKIIENHCSKEVKIRYSDHQCKYHPEPCFKCTSPARPQNCQTGAWELAGWVFTSAPPWAFSGMHCFQELRHFAQVVLVCFPLSTAILNYNQKHNNNKLFATSFVVQQVPLTMLASYTECRFVSWLLCFQPSS